MKRFLLQCFFYFLAWVVVWAIYLIFSWPRPSVWQLLAVVLPTVLACLASESLEEE